METTTVTSVTEKYLRGSEELISSSPAFLATLQREGIRNFMDKGFPTTRNEEWKYTNLAPIVGHQYNLNATGGKLTKELLQQLSILKNSSIVIVFENGKMNRTLSSLSSLPEGLIVDDLANHLNHASVQKHIGKYADGNEEAMVALNTVFVKHGCFIHVRKNFVIDQPVYILYVQTTNAALSYPRNLFIAEENSSVNILESVHSLSESTFTNAVTEIVLEKNAKLELTKTQAENATAARVDHTEAVLEKDALFHIHTISVSDGLTRNDLHIVLNGENANAYLNGLYIAKGKSHIDNHTLVDHAKPHCYTNELYKGIIDDHAHGVFNGKIMVRKDAQKTNAYQSNKNIILSDDATMNAKPQLEIYADDVKCSHGATTGRFDEESLFYLRSRGIGKQEAQALLTIAFANDVISKISIEEIKEELEALIHRSLSEKN